MKTTACPDAIIIGRIVVYTRNRFLAREVEELVERERLPERTSAGKMRLGTDNIAWVALPCSANANAAYQLLGLTPYD